MTKVELYKSRVFVTIIHLCALGQFAYGLYYSNFEVQRSYKLKTSLNRRLVPETFPQKLRFLSYWSLVSQISYILYIFINIKTYIGHTVVILIWRKCGRNRFKWALDSRSEKKRKEWKEIRLLLSPIYVCHMFVYTYVRVSVCLYSMMTVEVFYLLPAAGVNNCIRIFQIHFKFQAKHIRHSFVVTAKCCTQRERETDFHTRKEREEDSKRLSIYFLRHLRKFGEISLALLNCKIRPQIKIPPPRRPHENKRRLGRILLALMDARLSYWRECKYAIHGHAMSGRAWQRLATHLHVVKYANNSKIYRNFTDNAVKVRRTTSKS